MDIKDLVEIGGFFLVRLLLTTMVMIGMGVAMNAMIQSVIMFKRNQYMQQQQQAQQQQSHRDDDDEEEERKEGKSQQ